MLADAAVGRVIRSKKLPLAGGAGFRVGLDVLDSGLWPGWRDDRGVGFAEEVLGLGLGAAGALFCVVLLLAAGAGSGSCFAFEAAVGAVRRDGKSIGLVVFGLLGSALAVEGFVEVLLEVDAFLSEPAVFDIDAAVGAMSELRLGFLAGCFCFGDSAFGAAGALLATGDFGWLAEDLTVLDDGDGFAGDLAGTGEGLAFDGASSVSFFAD